jgi:spore coat protein U-like protein
MKKILLVAAVLVIVVVMAGGAFAESLKPTVLVTGTVTNKCTTPVNGTIAFTIDPAAAGPITANTTFDGTSPSVKCTKNSSHAVSCASAYNNLSVGGDGSTDPIPYTITGCTTPLTGAGFSTAVEIPLGISMTAGNYQDALAGPHSDTITVTVAY